MPSLWIELDLGDKLTLDPFFIIPTWLSNSGTLPINLRIHFDSWSEKWNTNEAARLIVENYNRFRNFSGAIDVDLLRNYISNRIPFTHHS
jgi:hypothetical protein